MKAKQLLRIGLPTLAVGAIALIDPAGTPPARAITVFDPSNYSQNILTAARTLQQVNNQIRSLQNEATMLINMGKNLSKIDFPELAELTEALQQIDRLMGEAGGVNFHVAELETQLSRLFPETYDDALSGNEQVAAARARLDSEWAAYKQAMAIQNRIVANVREDAETLKAAADKSQGAEGSLQAQQATNQLLALTAKQQLQLQELLASQYRAQAVEQARRLKAETDAKGATTRFLGSGHAYRPD